MANPLPEIQEYWTDRSDDIPIRGNEDRNDSSHSLNNNDSNEEKILPMIFITPSTEAMRNPETEFLSDAETPTDLKFSNFDRLFLKKLYLKDSHPLSPNLIYNRDTWFAGSPNLSYSSDHVKPYGDNESRANQIDGETFVREEKHQSDICIRNERVKKTSPPITPQR